MVGTFFYISHTCLVKQVHVWNAMWNNLCTLTHSVLRQCLLMRRLKKFLSRNCWLTLIVKKVCRSIQRFLFGLDATSVKHISCVRFAISFLTAFLNVRKKTRKTMHQPMGLLSLKVHPQPQDNSAQVRLTLASKSKRRHARPGQTTDATGPLLKAPSLRPPVSVQPSAKMNKAE